MRRQGKEARVTRHRLVAAWALLFGVLAACGGDEGAAAPATATATSGSGIAASTTGQGTSAGSVGSTAGGGGESPTSAVGAGGGAALPCTEVTLGALLLVDTDPGGSSLAYELLGRGGAQEHALYVEFFDVAGPQVAGTYDLGAAPDDNYSTCARCLLAFEDVNGAAPTPFFPSKGLLHVTLADAAFSGASTGTFEDVELAEVTLESTVTTRVPGGRCLSLSGGWDSTAR